MDIAGIAAILKGSKKKYARKALWEEFDDKTKSLIIESAKIFFFFPVSICVIICFKDLNWFILFLTWA